MLTHTSGLATNLAAGLLEPTSAAEWLEAAAATPAIACPGSIASYSNIGYGLLGRGIGCVEGQPFGVVLPRRIASPLALRQLRALSEKEEQGNGLALPHEGRRPVGDRGAWLRIGSGHVIASAQDMQSVWRALLEGRLLRPETVRRQWAVLFPIEDASAGGPGTAHTWFGQGVMLMEWNDAAGHPRFWLGHLGGISTANAVVAYDPASDVYVAVAVNNQVSLATVANALLELMVRWRSGAS